MIPKRASGLIALLLGMACLMTTSPSFANAPFSGEQVIANLAGTNSVAAGQLDGSNSGDVFYSASGSSALAVALRQANGTWSTQTLTSLSTQDIGVADLDGDGDNDLYYRDFGAGRVYWQENDLDSSGTFLARVEIANGIGGAQGLDAADIDGDNDLDVVVAGRQADGYFWIENTNGDASAWTRHTITTGVNAAQKVVAADLDGDGDIDVAGGSSSGSGKLAWYENVGGDGLSWVSRDVYSSRIGALAAGDLDLDGDVDLLVQDIVGDDILWWENTAGDGSAWTGRAIASFPVSRSGLQAADLDFDGDLDVVGDPRGDWWENNNKASSWTRRSYSGGTDIFDTDVLDIDEDGDRDIIAVRNSVGQVSWWENLTCSPGDADADSDGVRDDCDVCAGSDDTQDADGDLTPDGCDACPGFDDRVDNNGDSVPDACESMASISIDNVTKLEGDSGATSFTFTVTLSGTVAGGFTVGYATQDQTATTANADYVATSGTLTFAGNDGEQETITVSVLGDDRVEGADTFHLVLGTLSSGSVSVTDDTGLGTLANDDTASISVDDPTLIEGDGGTTGLTFTITLTGDVDDGFDLETFTGDFTATAANNDYVPSSPTLSFAGTDGEQQTVTIQVVGDTTVEADEQLNLNARDPQIQGILVPDGRGFGTIQNDDSATLTIDDVSQVETNAGTIFTFTVSLTGEVQDGFTVPYATADGSATVADNDYTAASGSLTFTGADGETQSIDVTVNGDTKVESDETFTVELGTPSLSGVSAIDGSGQGTVENDDSATIAIDDVSQVETDSGATTFTFTVTLTGEVQGGFTVPYNTADGSATVADTDYAATSGSLLFTGTAGETQTIDVTVNGDTKVESDETFTVELGSPSSADVTATDGSGQGTVENDDSATIAIDDVSQVETDSGTTVFTFTVMLTGEVQGGFTVPYSTADGSATVADTDYAATSGSLLFTGTAGETRTIDVPVNGDPVVESDETFTVELGSPSSTDVTASDGSGQGTVENDDSATIAVDDVSQVETDSGPTTFTFTVTLTGEVQGGFDVPYSTADGSATVADTDYAATSGSLLFMGTAGETQTLDVTVNGDTKVESDETFTVELGAPSLAGVTASDGSGQGTVENDDTATIAIDDVSQVETDSGPTTFTFTVTLTGEVQGGFDVPYNTADGSATVADGDYAATSGSLLFTGTAGETQTLDVTVNGDTKVEADETFTVELGSPSSTDVTATDGSGQGTVENDDSATLTIDDVSQAETNAGTIFTFTVSLTGEVQDGFTVPYATADGSATVADNDYTAASGSLTFTGADGETQSIDVTVNGDTKVESDETFTVELGTPSLAGVTATDGSGQGTVENDDTATIAIDDVSQVETDSGPTVFTFTVTLTGEVQGGFDVPYSTADGSATVADTDYAATSGSLLFTGTAGETQSIDVTVNGDTKVESDETFTVELGSPSSTDVTATDGSGQGTVENDDSATIVIDDVSQVETDSGPTTFTFTVTLTGEVQGGFDVPYNTVDGSATVADNDYAATSGSLLFTGTAGETRTIDVPVNGDPVVEGDETFTVELGATSDPAVGVADGSGLGTIQNDDEGALLVASKRVASYESPFGTVVYSIEITNIGDGDQQDDPSSDELEDLLPDELGILSASSDSADFVISIDQAANAIYGNGTLAPGETVVVTLEAVVDAESGDEIANQALVRFDADHDGMNDSSNLSDDPSTPEPQDPTLLLVLSFVEIPTLGSWGFTAMILLLAAAAARMIRRT